MAVGVVHVAGGEGRDLVIASGANHRVELWLLLQQFVRARILVVLHLLIGTFGRLHLG